MNRRCTLTTAVTFQLQAITVLRARDVKLTAWQRPWQFAQMQLVGFVECYMVNEAVVLDEMAVMCGCEEVRRSDNNDWL